MGLCLIKLQAIQQPAQFTVIDLLDFFFRAFGPFEFAAFQTAVVEPEAVMLPL